MPEPARPEKPEPVADAASLFDTDEVRPFHAPMPARPDGPPAASDGYDLLEPPTAELEAPPPRLVPIPEPEPAPPVPRARPKSKKPAAPQIAEGDTSEFEREISIVDPIWTRGAEWGPDFARVGMAAAGTLALAWLCSGSWTLCLGALAAGGAATLLLCYPILITLERPVRITPEQAVTDFYAAASHRLPHYRRMYLLLSSAGRESGPFPEFRDFRDHWQARVEAWRGTAGKFAPLQFEVEDFRADKSTGKSTSRAEYTVRVLHRGESEPIESFRVSHGLVKGPDRMWYLNRGLLGPSPR